MGTYYFLMCLLPPPPTALGEKMPLPLGEITKKIQKYLNPKDIDILDIYLLSIDVANFENVAQGHDIFIEGGLLSREELHNKKNLPQVINNFLEEQNKGIGRHYIYDRLWEIYYSRALAVAEKCQCKYLSDYLSWEVSLRNSIAGMRARMQRKNPADYVISNIGIKSLEFSDVMPQIKSRNPLQAERFLDEERLKYIYHFECIDPFSIDAVLAYISRAMIYSRWENMNRYFDVVNFLDEVI
jgi:hypothetical protein